MATEAHRWPSFEKMAFLDKVYIPRGWVAFITHIQRNDIMTNNVQYFIFSQKLPCLS